MAELFKERARKKSFSEQLTRELVAALGGTAEDLTSLLLGIKGTPVLYSEKGEYKDGDHAEIQCKGFDSGPLEQREKRLCKCLYYFNNNRTQNCDSCQFHDRYKLKGFSIIDYEVPSFYYAPKIGEIDLVIKYENENYATEVKPYAGNEEPLIRMIAEIMTYTDGYEDKFKKAIGFFENSPQHDEYKALPADSKLKELLDAAQITVFLFKRDTRKGELSIEVLLHH